MLRYHMAVITKDAALKRNVKRLTTATGATADFIGDASGITAERPVSLAIFDAREANPDKLFFSKVPAEAKIIYIVQENTLLDKLPLFKDDRATSLFCHDDRFDDDEFIATSTKALRMEIFGLQKYFPWGVTTFTMKVKNHAEKSKAIDVLMQYANLAGCRGAVRDRIQLVCDELMMNALYHAPTDDKGNEKYAGRTLKELAQLDDVSPIQVQYGCSGRYFGVSVRDGGGSLSRPKLLDYLNRAKNGAHIEDKAGGAGLGLVSVLKSVSKLIFHLDKGTSTEVIGLFDMELFAKGKMGARSLHIFAAPPRKEEPAEVEPPKAEAEAPVARTSNRAWMVALLLFAVASSLATATYMQRNMAGAAATAERSVTVFAEPADATVTLDGATIPAGTRVTLGKDAPGVLVVAKPGFAEKQLTLDAKAPESSLYVTLVPAR